MTKTSPEATASNEAQNNSISEAKRDGEEISPTKTVFDKLLEKAPAQKSDFAAKVTARNHDDQDDVDMSDHDDEEDSSSSGLKISSIVTMANKNDEPTTTDGSNDKSNGNTDNNSQKDVSYLKYFFFL